MKTPFNKTATNKATNLSVNQELLAEAKRLKINLSATLEQALTREVQAKQQQEWLKNNKEAIEACNKLAEKYGLFSDEFREF